MPQIDVSDLRETLATLVRTPSENPAFTGGRTDESAVAEQVAGVLRELGLEVTEHEPARGRMSVVGRLRGRGGGLSLMLYAHHDTVGVEGMDEPFAARVEGNRLYGRGAYDMKGGLAACIAALRALLAGGGGPRGDVLVVSVADEEDASLGMEEVLRHHTADAAIVTEPTELAVCTAHKGFAWIEVVAHGRAAHGSRPHLGEDANLAMARVLGEIAAIEASLRDAAPHPLLGRPSLHVGVLRGGTGPSVYAAESRAVIERRTLPGESAAAALAEVETAVARAAAGGGLRGGIRIEVRTLLARDAFEASADSRIVAAVRAAHTGATGSGPPPRGVSFWTDAALLAAAGIDTVLLGPAGEGAHADVEWVDLDSVAMTARILARSVVDFCGWDRPA